MAAAPKPDWLQLQIKIFTRWINQKLAIPRGAERRQIKNVLTDLSDGVVLVDLMEILSEKSFPGKKFAHTDVRVKKMDNLGLALKFVWDCGVTMELQPSVENICDGEEKQVLGLVWGIMRKFLKFGDDQDEQKLNARDALLMWVQNQVAGYPGVAVENFGKSFHNGLALCALIHKFRPKLVPFDQLSADQAEHNLRTAFAAAEKYFGLEQYLQPSDIAKLDEKSMVIYVSEYFYGIAERRRWDLAGRRITKLVKYTKENDAMRAEFLERSRKLQAALADASKLLNDRAIDNTMAGARRRMDEFNAYRAQRKPGLVSDFLGLESLANHLALRLADHKRPPFQPGAGLAVADHRAVLAAIDALEQVRNTELNAELNRQHKLAQLNAHHAARFGKLSAWLREQNAFLGTKEEVTSTGAAYYHLNKMVAYENEAKAIQAGSVAELGKLGRELQDNKFEGSAEVASREAQVAAGLKENEALASHKRAVLEDGLAREQFKEPVMLLADQHRAKFDLVMAWAADRVAYLQTPAAVDSISAAKLQLSLLDAFEQNKEDQARTAVAALKAMGARILAARFEGRFSQWAFEPQSDITQREAAVEGEWQRMATLAAAKREALLADLQREERKEQLRLEFANAAGDYENHARDVAEEAASTHFGFNLAEVEAFGATLAAADATFAQLSDQRVAAIQALFDELAALNNDRNQYTALTPAAVKEVRAAAETALAARRAAYATELARQRANDALCKEFAALAAPFAAHVQSSKDKITASQEKLDAQLAEVARTLGDQTHAAQLPKMQELQRRMDEAKITVNPHSNLTFTDVTVMWQQYQAFLQRKKAQLEEEIQHQQLRGLTKEQYAEIRAQFNQFDKNKNQILDKKEFKACLYSLGDDRPSREIDQIMDKYGSREKGITYKGFEEFMITQLGDTDTKDEIVQGFRLISHDKPVTTVAELNDILADAEVEYLKANVPAKDGGLDYAAWTESVFAR